MERARGIGGVFFRSRGDRKALLDWYKTHLGLDVEAAWGGCVFRDPAAEEEGLTWSIFKSDTTYFGGGQFMINYKVDDLHAMRKQLIDAGVEVLDQVDESEYGKFGWAVDPEGNRFELWQPPD